MNLQVPLVLLFLFDEDADTDIVDYDELVGTHVFTTISTSTAQVQFVQGRSEYPACILLLIEHS